jgi:hypothetical protein
MATRKIIFESYYKSWEEDTQAHKIEIGYQSVADVFHISENINGKEDVINIHLDEVPRFIAAIIDLYKYRGWKVEEILKQVSEHLEK